MRTDSISVQYHDSVKLIGEYSAVRQKLNIPVRAVVTKQTKGIVVKTALVLHTRVCKAVHKVECKRVYKVEESVAD